MDIPSVIENPPIGLTLVSTLGGHADSICVFEWSRDGRWLATPSRDESCRIWEVVGVEGLTGKVEPHHILSLRSEGLACAWHPQSATVGVTYGSGISFCSLGGAEPREWTAEPGGGVWSLSFDDEGRLLTCFREDVSWWDRNYQGIRSSRGAASPLNLGRGLLRLGPTSFLMTGAAGLRIVDSKALRLGEILPNSGHVQQAAVSPRGGDVVAISQLGPMRRWRSEGGRFVEAPAPTEVLKTPLAVEFSPDGALLAVKDRRGVHFWRTDTWQYVVTLDERDQREDHLHGIAFNPRLPILATLSPDGCSVRLWEINVEALLNAYPPSGPRLDSPALDPVSLLYGRGGGAAPSSTAPPSDTAPDWRSVFSGLFQSGFGEPDFHLDAPDASALDDPSPSFEPGDRILLMDLHDSPFPPISAPRGIDLPPTAVIRIPEQHDPQLASRLRQPSFDEDAWQEAIQAISRGVERAATGLRGRLHVVVQAPHPAAFFLGRFLDLAGRAARVIVYQWDAWRRRFDPWLGADDGPVLNLSLLQDVDDRGGGRGAVLSIEIPQAASEVSLLALAEETGARSIRSIRPGIPEDSWLPDGRMARAVLNEAEKVFRIVRGDVPGEPLILATSLPISLMVGLGMRLSPTAYPEIVLTYYDPGADRYVPALIVAGASVRSPGRFELVNAPWKSAARTGGAEATVGELGGEAATQPTPAPEIEPAEPAAPGLEVASDPTEGDPRRGVDQPSELETEQAESTSEPAPLPPDLPLPPNPQVFISYSRNPADQQFARALAEHLRRCGFEPWLDEERIPPSSDIEEAIAAAIASSIAAVFIVSRSWSEKRWCRFELQCLAERREVRRVPVRREEVTLSDLGPSLSGVPGIPWPEELGQEETQANFWLLRCGILGQAPGPKREHVARGARLMEGGPGLPRAPTPAQAEGLLHGSPVLGDPLLPLKCDRTHQWGEVTRLADVPAHLLILVPGARGQGHVYFSLRVQQAMRGAQAAERLRVKWPNSRPPTTWMDARRQLAEALRCPPEQVSEHLRRHLDRAPLWLIHPTLGERHLDPCLADYYSRWLQDVLRSHLRESRFHLRLLQPIAWEPATAAQARLARWAHFLWMEELGRVPRWDSERRARTLIKALQGAPGLLEVRCLEDLHEISDEHLLDFCKLARIPSERWQPFVAAVREGAVDADRLIDNIGRWLIENPVSPDDGHSDPHPPPGASRPRRS